MNNNEMIDAIVSAIANAVWAKLENKVDEKLAGLTVSTDQIRKQVNNTLDGIDFRDLIDTRDLAREVKGDLECYLDDKIDIERDTLHTDIKHLVRDELSDLTFKVKVD